MLGEHRLDALQEGDEKRLAVFVIAGMRLQQEGDRMGSALAQVAAGLIRRVVEPCGCFQNALARLRVNAGAAVECPRNGSDGNVQMAGQIANIQAF